ncbi:MAG: thiol-disulfide oxidoreductase DCC family protein [Haloarculaceae archaeon]
MSDRAREDHPVLLFDGVCNLCNGTVQFVIEHDPEGIFRFAPLQSDVAGDLLAERGRPREYAESFVLVDGDDWYTKSDAALRVVRRLGVPWSLLSAFLVVPRPLRDAVYDFVAEHRYEWFGKRESCMVPTDDVTDRFLATNGNENESGAAPGD